LAPVHAIPSVAAFGTARVGDDTGRQQPIAIRVCCATPQLRQQLGGKIL
jgi:hypothetical protein